MDQDLNIINLEELSSALESLEKDMNKDSSKRHFSEEQRDLQSKLSNVIKKANKAFRTKKYDECITKCNEGIALANKYKESIQNLTDYEIKQFNGLSFVYILKVLAASLVFGIGHGTLDTIPKYRKAKKLGNAVVDDMYGGIDKHKVDGKPKWNEEDQVYDVESPELHDEAVAVRKAFNSANKKEAVKTASRNAAKLSGIMVIASTIAGLINELTKTKKLKKSDLIRVCNTYIKGLEALKQRAVAAKESKASESCISLESDTFLDNISGISILLESGLSEDLVSEIYDIHLTL